MKKSDFKNLKVGDFVYFKSSKNRYTGTPVLKVDRYFEKVSVLLGRKPYSYKFVQLKLPNHQCCTSYCGIAHC